MIFWAAAGSLHRSGASARAFSSSSLTVALSQSKMPPQQRERLLDVIDGFLGFSFHIDRLLRLARAP
jgi:hypothetical protein